MVKFVVRVDGKWHECKNVQSLEKVLQGILPGSKCRVFRNAGFGATIDFDIN
jgi:Fe2+ transport system protein FeoA